MGQQLKEERMRIEELSQGLMALRCMQVRLTKEFEDFTGFSLSRYLILVYLMDHDKCLQMELAKAVGIDKAAITRHLKVLEEKGYVMRERDGREVLVCLTDEGKSCMQGCTCKDKEMDVFLLDEEIALFESFGLPLFDGIVYGRKSIREFDESVKITQREMAQILQEACLAPSSVNLQPWRFVVVESVEGKKKLEPLVMFNGVQNTTSSAMILIFGDLQCYEKADTIYSKAVKHGVMSEARKKKALETFVPIYKGFDETKMESVVKIDCSLAAMQLMLVARRHGYDTNAIGGFEEDKLAKTFGLDPNRFIPVMIVAIGKAKEQGHDSIRLDVDEVVSFV